MRTVVVEDADRMRWAAGLSRPISRTSVRSCGMRRADQVYGVRDADCGIVNSVPFQMRSRRRGESRGTLRTLKEIATCSSPSKSLPRRTFLRGMGATLALPLARRDGSGADGDGQDGRRAGAPHRLHLPSRWGRSTTSGRRRRTAPASRCRASSRRSNRCATSCSSSPGCATTKARRKGDGSFPHPRAGAVWLSGVHAAAVTTVGAEVKSGRRPRTRLAARTIGKETILPVARARPRAAERVRMRGRARACFSSTLSWKDEKTPVPMESHPRIVFERLFGAGRQRRRSAAPSGRRDASILDSVAEDAARLQQAAGRRRSHEARRIPRFGARGRAAHQPRRAARRDASSSCRSVRPAFRPTGKSMPKLMFDLQVLAFQTDITRVFIADDGARAERPRLQEPRACPNSTTSSRTTATIKS